MISENPGFVRTTAAGTFETHKAILEAIYELAGRGVMIDLGCGEAHVTKNWPGFRIDAIQREHVTDIMDLRDFYKYARIVAGGDINLCVMTDSIEHLTEIDARWLLHKIEKWCNAVVIFTPCGPYRMDPTATDPDAHKSAWCPEQFWKTGWEVWEWPAYHRFDSGAILGAFWAWRFKNKPTPTVAEVAKMAGIELTA